MGSIWTQSQCGYCRHETTACDGFAVSIGNCENKDGWQLLAKPVRVSICLPTTIRARVTCQMSRWTTESGCWASTPNTWIWCVGREVWERAGILNAFYCALDGWNFPKCLEGHLSNPWRGNGRILTIRDGSWVTRVRVNREDYLTICLSPI